MQQPATTPDWRLTRRAKIAGATALALAGVIFWAALLVSGVPFAHPTFRATLTETGSGALTNPAYSGGQFVNISLTFTGLGSIAASSLLMAVTSHSAPFFDLNRTPYWTAPLPYYADETPHWIQTLAGNEQGGFVAFVTDSDGAMVGDYSCSGPWTTGGCSSVVADGATLTLLFPDNIPSPSGYVVTVTDQGISGSASVTLS